MIIATFNANSLRSRLEIVLKWLAENQPDVLCIQETKVQDVDFPAKAFEGSGYEFVFKGQKKYNGVAIFSKHKIQQVEIGLTEDTDEEARLIKAVINDVVIINTYVPQGREPESDKFQYKLDWLKKLGEFIAQRFDSDQPVIWTGDLNCAMDERDVHDPDRLWGHVCYCQPVQDAIMQVMDWGFEDVFRSQCDSGGKYTFWDYRAKNALTANRGWRLDYIMATYPLLNNTVRSWIDTGPRSMTKPSDHTFLAAEFDI